MDAKFTWEQVIALINKAFEGITERGKRIIQEWKRAGGDDAAWFGLPLEDRLFVEREYHGAPRWEALKLYRFKVVLSQKDWCEACGGLCPLYRLQLHHDSYRDRFHESPLQMRLLHPECHQKLSLASRELSEGARMIASTEAVALHQGSFTAVEDSLSSWGQAIGAGRGKMVGLEIDRARRAYTVTFCSTDLD